MPGMPSAEIERLLVAERLASDATNCPVRYDVWREYALHGPQARPQLILERAPKVIAATSGETTKGETANFSTRPERLVNEIQLRYGRIRPSGVRSQAYPTEGVTARIVEPESGTLRIPPDGPLEIDLKVAYFGDWMVISPNLSELVAVVFPFTGWGSLVRDALGVGGWWREGPAEFADLLRPPTDPERAYALSTPSRRQQSWLFRLLARIWGNDPDLESERNQAALRLARYLGEQAYPWSDETPLWYSQWSGLVSSVNLDRPVTPAISVSSRVVKADVARKAFEINCSHLTWAVLDSGIDARHIAFRDHSGRGQFPVRVTQILDFNKVSLDNFREVYAEANFVTKLEELISLDLPSSSKDNQYKAPTDSHGTHVAGILAGDWSGDPNNSSVRGICPDMKLWDLRVIGESAEGLESRVLMALVYLRERNAQSARLFKDGLRVVGANLSLSVPYNPHTHACGWTPVCREVRQLVRAGVVVVAAAGNTGFSGQPAGSLAVGSGFDMVGITDPGNAADAITVGATGRFEPTRYGASYFSSKGPTADGRPKPDLLAPGQGIFSAAGCSDYVSKDGTSQSAPHVSGAAALLMARNSELIADPERIKTILCATATDLGREKSFQGHGLLDIFRALQSV